MMTISELFRRLKDELPGMTISVRHEIWHHEFPALDLAPTDQTIWRAWVDEWGAGFSDFDDPKKVLRQVLLYREGHEEAGLRETRERPMVRILKDAIRDVDNQKGDVDGETSDSDDRPDTGAVKPKGGRA